MDDKSENIKFWTGIPPWIFIGAVVVLFPIFSFITIQNINRQNENSLRLLLEKGAALIRSFEAGTRTGMGLRWNNHQLQQLLTETAQQPDILYLLVSDINGTILAHDNPSHIGKRHGKGLNLNQIARIKKIHYRFLPKLDGKEIFEVFRMFSPTEGHMGMRHGRMMMQMWLGQDANRRLPMPSDDLIIFVGLDTTAIEEAKRSDIKHTVIMGVILLFVGFAGVIFLFLAQSYRTTKTSLSRIKAFSDNLVDHMPIGLIAMDDNKHITSFNHVAGSVLDLSTEDVIGKNAEQVIPKELWRLLDNLDPELGVVEKELDCTIYQGNVIPLEASATLLNDNDGQFLGYVFLFKDLSEVRSLRKEIARSQRLASVGRLAAGVSHEIRNPLSSIKGFATYFKERYHDVPENQQISNLMIQEVDRLNRVVSQLHEFARPITISKKTIHVRSFIEDSLKLIERQAIEKGIQIETSLAVAIDTVSFDPDRLNQVLLNLYLNAIESMEDGGKLTVLLTWNEEKHLIEIRLSDTGTGISEDDLAHVFDPYFTTKASGTGLGLAIVHNIIEAHDGEIRIESVMGEGTTITMLLPQNVNGE
ncbi:MAG: PAS domain-containing protein [Desulfobacterales bacterium]|nr:MAG: PAS domain-containing protein [Desulfobacterales bacterium]